MQPHAMIRGDSADRWQQAGIGFIDFDVAGIEYSEGQL